MASSYRTVVVPVERMTMIEGMLSCSDVSQPIWPVREARARRAEGKDTLSSSSSRSVSRSSAKARRW